ncbi:carbonic anhydrase [Cadophora sp. DSE1049]|nr:carbonic anhydrase [Cadophora sp. DSE1049]
MSASLEASKAKVASLLAKNLKYSETYKAPNLLSVGIQKNRELGRKSTVIISCSDPRVHPTQFLDLDFSEAAIIRNAGGRTSDVMRSLLDLDAVGSVGTVIVVHHIDCGMSQTDEHGFQERIRGKHPAIAASQPGYVYGAVHDPEQTVVHDVEFLKSFTSIAENMHIVGLVLDTFTGRLKEVI